MGERWESGAVLALVPDAASGKAARKLWGAPGWSGEGCREQVVWGLCAGSGKNPYRVRVDLSGPAFTCSCPSRKFPCKHALALLLRWSEGIVPDAEQVPDDVGQWLTARGAQAQKAAERSQTLAAPQTAARRQERVEAGITELRRWLEDLIATGLATVRTQGAAPFDRMAARLVDAQAPGLAGWVRELPALMTDGPGWASLLTTELALLHLLARAHAGLDDLRERDPDLAASVREYVGYPVPRQTVLDRGARVADVWSVYTQVDEPVDRLMRRTVHLQGAHTGRHARIVSFGPDPAGLDADLAVGTRVDADLVFYPAAVPGRALLADRRVTHRGIHPPHTGTLAQALAARAEHLTRDPWLAATEHWIRGVLTPADGAWQLADPDTGQALALHPREKPWQALAHSHAAEADYLIGWSRRGCRPLVCRTEQAVLPL